MDFFPFLAIKRSNLQEISPWSASERCENTQDISKVRPPQNAKILKPWQKNSDKAVGANIQVRSWLEAIARVRGPQCVRTPPQRTSCSNFSCTCDSNAPPEAVPEIRQWLCVVTVRHYSNPPESCSFLRTRPALAETNGFCSFPEQTEFG